MKTDFLPCSKLGFQLALAASVDLADHVSKVRHAHVEAARVAEQAFVELLLVLFGVVWSVANRLAVLLIRITSPHAVDRLLASQKVVGLACDHLEVADLHTNLVVLTVPVLVADETDFVSSGSNSLDLSPERVVAASLLPVVHRVVDVFVKPGVRRFHFDFNLLL